jgi:Chaperone of endosialidase
VGISGDVNIGGNINSGTWSGTTISVTKGGTGLTSPGAAGNVLTSDGTNWITSAGGSGVNTLTYTTASSYTTGGTISGTTLTLAAADATNPGLVSVDAQTIVGAKTFSSTVTASGSLGSGTIFTPTLVAAANSDVLTGIDISPKFTNGSFTGVANYGLRVQGIGIGVGGGDAINNITNTAVGNSALLKNTTTGIWNTGVGYKALLNNLSGSGNTAFGYQSLYNNNSVTFTTALGYNTGNPVSSSYVLTKGIYLGANALPKASSSTTNEIVIGSDLYGNGNNTTTIGNTSTQQSQIYGALTVVANAAPASTNGISSTITAQNATTATYGGGNLNLTAGNAGTTGQGGNIVLTPGTSSYAANTGKVIVSSDMTVNGITAGRGNGNSTNNTIFGNAAFGSNTTGTNNVAFGTTSLYANTTGNQNTAFGSFALSSLSGTYHNNTAIGANAIQNMKVGGDNVALGNNAAGVAADGTSLVTSSSQSVFIGSNSKPGTTSSTNEIVIGYNAKGQGDNTTTIGNSSTTQTYLPSGLTMGNSLGSVDASLTLGPNSTSAQGGAEGGQLNFKKSVSTSTYDWFIDQYADGNGARLRFLPGRTNPESFGMAISENGYVGMGSIPTSSYRLNVSGTVGATGYVNTSDLRLKTNISGLNSAMKTLNLLSPVSYDKKVSLADSVYEKHEFGFIAQEVQKVLPQLVTEGKDKDHLLSMDYISIIPLITKAMQEQDAIIKDAQKENKQLKEQISQQKKRLDAIELTLKKLNLTNN